MSKKQEEAIQGYVARKLEIAVDEAAELLGVSMDAALAILDGMPEYTFTPKAYRGRTDYPNVYHLPLGPDPRLKADGTRDMGHALSQNAHRGAFESRRAMGDGEDA
ncbi:MAG: hypothetical protein Q8Q14_02640 [Gemmatimonadales bacterium]|nr:hypothetical protein [Gemmatimonadales bacterium]